MQPSAALDLWVTLDSVFIAYSLVPYVCAEGCEVGQWSEWGACTRRNKTCGYKWGLETRTRHIVKKPPKDTIPCPTIAESRMCKMATRHCRRGKDVLLLHVSITRYFEKKTSHVPHRSTHSSTCFHVTMVACPSQPHCFPAFMRYAVVCFF